ncbi:MAG: protein-disulfide reductase DsbD N-terminal domain-containing protein, partial [Cyclobacteriaceae bacterium]|nr:protein-disulfide reductase DsbD N-terminal domain-containing protein [Cyclobacteriaceae bacterium]
MIKSVYFSLFFLLIANLQAQILDPILWSEHAEKKDVEVGEEIKLFFKMEIEPNWYVYANDFDPDCGPNLTTFNFVPNDSYKLIGDPIGEDAKEKYDEIFDCAVKIFVKKGTFSQKIKVLNKDLRIEGSLEFQTCNEITGVCLPPKEVDFSFTDFIVKGKISEVKEKEEEVQEVFPAENNINNIQVDEASPVEVKPISKKDYGNIQGPILSDSLSMEGVDKKSLWLFAVFAFLAGLTALLTP